MNVRLLPMLGISASALLVLKVLGFILGPHAGMQPVVGAVAQETGQAQTDGNGEAPPPGGEASVAMPDAGADGEAPPAADAAAENAPVLPETLEIGGSAAERAVLESLGERRKQLDKQRGQLDLREKLLQATEERIQKRVDELKQLESKIKGAVEEKKKQEETELAGLVTMYESMKPKDAARIFDRLEINVLLKVVRQMKPRKMADILGKMSSESAERLTVAIASSADPEMANKTATSANLPKISSN